MKTARSGGNSFLNNSIISQAVRRFLILVTKKCRIYAAHFASCIIQYDSRKNKVWFSEKNVTHFHLNHIMKCIKILEETIVSDLAATNCGCNGGCGCGGSNNGGCNSCSIIIWIILLSCLCGNGNGTGLSNIFGCGNGDDCGGCGGGCSNNSCVWLILILLFCGGGCGF